MRVLVQRVASARVEVDGTVVGAIGTGLLALVGVAVDERGADVEWCADKVVGLRIFRDAEDHLSRSVADVGGAILSVSQFTLYGDVGRGRRPAFTEAAPPDVAERWWQHFNDRMRGAGTTVATGRFRANMAVHLVNDGPVTLWIDSAARRRGP